MTILSDPYTSTTHGAADRGPGFPAAISPLSVPYSLVQLSFPSTLMSSSPTTPRNEPEYEGDYRPADSQNPHAHLDPFNVRVEPGDLTYLVQMADALNTTLDLDRKSVV